jgi:hypothetical protein
MGYRATEEPDELSQTICSNGLLGTFASGEQAGKGWSTTTLSASS